MGLERPGPEYREAPFRDGLLLGSVLVEWGHGAGVRLAGAREAGGLLELDLDFLRGGPSDTTTDVLTWERERLRLPVPPSSPCDVASLVTWLEAAASAGRRATG